MFKQIKFRENKETGTGWGIGLMLGYWAKQWFGDNSAKTDAHLNGMCANTSTAHYIRDLDIS